jgi:hypothetical protein
MLFSSYDISQRKELRLYWRLVVSLLMLEGAWVCNRIAHGCFLRMELTSPQLLYISVTYARTGSFPALLLTPSQ